MKKTLYSLMLSEDVIREIDILAHQMGTNRSNLVNQILAERVRLTTPEQQINEIFSTLNELFTPMRELVPYYERGAATMSLKSCLEYKYRPTVRYEVELARGMSGGTLSVIFRTQSAALIEAMTRFFALWKRIEDAYLPEKRDYSLSDGRFVRTLEFSRSLSAEQLATAISEYIKLFDTLMKQYISGNSTSEELAAEYASHEQLMQLI